MQIADNLFKRLYRHLILRDFIHAEKRGGEEADGATSQGTGNGENEAQTATDWTHERPHWLALH